MRIIKPKRRAWRKREKLAILESTGGRCHSCGIRIRAGEEWDIDHIERLADGGLDEIVNVKPIHRRCHHGKTAGEAKVSAKADRIAARHFGIAAPSRRPIPGSKASGWIKHINGTVERRRP